MIDPSHFVDRLDALGVRSYTGVPDSLLKALGQHIQASVPAERHTITANEGAAIAMAMGTYLRTGDLGAVYLQNSGFGNIVNPLLSLADPDVYGVPMLVIVGWRGQPGVADEPQHVKQGRIMEPLLEALELPWAILPSEPAEADRVVEELVTAAREQQAPALLLVEKGTFAAAARPNAEPDPELAALPTREEALAELVAALGDDTINVSTTGMLSRELFELRQAHGGGDRDFLTVGGMGHACSIALGIAAHEPQRETWCLDGDGAVLMHLGSLAVIGHHAPATYFHVVFNNGVHDSVGGQPTAISTVDLPAVARSVGYRHAARTSDLASLPDHVAALRDAGGPALLELRVRPGNRSDLGRPTRTPRESREAFMGALR